MVFLLVTCVRLYGLLELEGSGIPNTHAAVTACVIFYTKYQSIRKTRKFYEKHNNKHKHKHTHRHQVREKANRKEEEGVGTCAGDAFVRYIHNGKHAAVAAVRGHQLE